MRGLLATGAYLGLLCLGGGGGTNFNWLQAGNSRTHALAAALIVVLKAFAFTVAVQ